MYDTLKFILKEDELDNEVCFMEEIPCRIVDVKYYENRVVGYIKNMKVEVRGTTLIVEGSLTKWFFGNNYEKNLSLWEIRAAIKKLSVALNVPMEKSKIVRIDIAFNFMVKNEPWLYLKRLLYLDSYHRSNIEKESLYFDKHDVQLVFYDKMNELKSRDLHGLEDLDHLHIVRYECRFKKVTRTFGEIRGECLYDPEFCLLLLDKWYRYYIDIDKQEEEKGIRFTGIKGLKESCVASCMSYINLFEGVEEAFARGEIDSAIKFAILKELRRIVSLYCDKEKVSFINELTNKISNAYVRMKRIYNIAPARMAVLNK